MFVAERAETGGHTIDRHCVIIGFTVKIFPAMLDFRYRLVRKDKVRAIIKDTLDQIIRKI